MLNALRSFWAVVRTGGNEMQWSTPRPRNFWPHDMVITGEDHLLSLNLLLLVRAQFWTTEYDWDGGVREAFTNWHRDLSPPTPHDAGRKSLSETAP
jgi:hypothetical protein